MNSDVGEHNNVFGKNQTCNSVLMVRWLMSAAGILFILHFSRRWKRSAHVLKADMLLLREHWSNFQWVLLEVPRSRDKHLPSNKRSNMRVTPQYNLIVTMKKSTIMTPAVMVGRSNMALPPKLTNVQPTRWLLSQEWALWSFCRKRVYPSLPSKPSRRKLPTTTACGVVDPLLGNDQFFIFKLC
jgi:hypothetical protein